MYRESNLSSISAINVRNMGYNRNENFKKSLTYNNKNRKLNFNNNKSNPYLHSPEITNKKGSIKLRRLEDARLTKSTSSLRNSESVSGINTVPTDPS